jgi:hypothetical protein
VDNRAPHRHTDRVADHLRAAQRLFIEDARRDGSYLRVTWHPDGRTFVVSHWNDTVCTAATRVAVEDAPPLVALLADGLGEAMAAPAAAPARIEAPRSAWARLRDRLGRRRSGAPVVDLPQGHSVFAEPHWRSNAG